MAAAAMAPFQHWAQEMQVTTLFLRKADVVRVALDTSDPILGVIVVAIVVAAAILLVLWCVHNRQVRARELAFQEGLPVVGGTRSSSPRESESELMPLPSTGNSRSRMTTEELVDNRDSFESCQSSMEQAVTPSKSTHVQQGPSFVQDPKHRENMKKRPRKNTNLITSYRWLEPVLQSIVNDEASLLGSTELATERACTPLFLVAGVCPSRMPPSPMQAVLFAQMPSGNIDFWWVKPEANNPSIVEQETMSRHDSGKFKNVAEKSKNLYQPLADKFAGKTDGMVHYGVDSRGRAYMEENAGNGLKRRMLVYFAWIENWSAGMTGRRFLEGKICFEKVAAPKNRGSGKRDAKRNLAARQFRIEDGAVILAPRQDEEPIEQALPGVAFQEMW